jgi:hypothetical protein
MQSQKENLSISYEYLEEKEKGKSYLKRQVNELNHNDNIHSSKNIKNKSTIPLIKKEINKKNIDHKKEITKEKQ